MVNSTIASRAGMTVPLILMIGKIKPTVTIEPKCGLFFPKVSLSIFRTFAGMGVVFMTICL